MSMMITLSPHEEEIFNANIGLVKKAAGKLARSAEEYDDRFQDGCIALMKVIKRFDSRKGLKFSTFAYSYIEKSMLTGKRNFDHKSIVKIPAWVWDNEEKLRESRLLITDFDFRFEGCHAVKDSIAAPEKIISIEENIDLKEALQVLKPRELEVINQFFYEGITLEELAKKYGLSKQRVAQIKDAALKKMGRKLNVKSNRCKK